MLRNLIQFDLEYQFDSVIIWQYACLIMLTNPLSLIMLTAPLLLFLNLHAYDDFLCFY
jgi:hypothetical protein